MEKGFRKEEIKESISVALLISVTLFIFGPLELYYTNIDEFFFGITDIIGWFVLLCAVSAFLLTVLQIIWKNRSVFALINAVLFAIGIGLYMQGTYLNADYGVINGAAIDWSGYKAVGLINSCIWIGILTASVLLSVKLKKETVTKIHIFFCAVIVAIETVTLAVLIVTTPRQLEVVAGNDKQFTVGDEENIIILLLDTFDGAVFDDMLEGEYGAEIKEEFRDFTYYDNMAGGYPFTTYAVPLILTGEWYDNTVSFNDFIEKESYTKSNLYKDLYETGWSIGLYSHGSLLGSSIADYTRNLHEGKETVSSSKGAAMTFLQLTAFRYLPHELKRFTSSENSSFDKFHEESAYKFFQDIDFYNKLQSEGLTVEEGKTFAFYHLKGIHYPYYMNENIEADTNATEESQALGELHIVESYLAQLKEKGVYDQSTIVVMADHGYKGMGQNPIFLVKEAGAHHELEVSSAPVSYDDLRGTYSVWTGQDPNGRSSIYDFQEGEERIRYFRWHTNGNEKKQEIPLVEWEINGEAGNFSCMKKTGVLYGENGAYQKDRIKFESELKIDFGLEGNYVDIIDSNYTWNGGIRSWGEYTDFVLDTSDYAGEDAKVDICLSYVFAPPQKIQLYVNDNFIDEVTAEFAGDVLSYVVPAEIFDQDFTKIRVAYPDMVDKIDGVGEYMSVAYDAIYLGQLDRLESGKSYTFGTGGNLNEIGWNGMSIPEDGLRWSSGMESNFYWSIPAGTEMQDLTFEIKLKVKINDDQRLKIYMNDNFIEEISLDELEFQVNVPADTLTEGVNNLRVEYPYAVSPRELNGSEDDRKLSVAWETLKIVKGSEG